MYRHRIKATIAAASVVTLSAAGCISHTVAGKPTAASPTTTSVTLPQAELLRDFTAEHDPMGVFQEGFYYLLRQPMATSVAITGYRHQVATDGATSKVAAFAFIPPTGAWQPIPDRELVWSPSQAKWVEADHTEALSPGPAGSPRLAHRQGRLRRRDKLLHLQLAGHQRPGAIGRVGVRFRRMGWASAVSASREVRPGSAGLSHDGDIRRPVLHDPSHQACRYRHR